MSAATCTHHCGRCGRHFHSLEAFDAHRTGDHGAANASEHGRRCNHPLDLDEVVLVEMTDSGECRLTAEDLRGVKIWASARSQGTRERFDARERFARAQRPAHEAGGAS